jgi:NAD+ synthase (glutamine-hydrolysing)
VDSAITAVIAVDALGAENVLGVFMPSPYTSRASREDVADLASRLHIHVDTLSITATFKSYLRALSRSFKGRRPDTTEENLQARIRGNLLMAYSNKFGHLVLTTGNKSEMSVGYATLYGDMAGGFAVIKDVPKTMVYELSYMRNQVGPAPVIPKRVLERAPTAELRPDQKDEDSLPPYAILDPILKAYVEEDRALEDIAAMGFDRETVARVIALVDRSEYKRAAGAAGDQDYASSVRKGSADADHQRVPVVRAASGPTTTSVGNTGNGARETGLIDRSVRRSSERALLLLLSLEAS